MPRGGATAAEALRGMAKPQTSLDELFSEEPPPLTVFVQDKKYLNNPRLSDPQYDAVRVLEQVLFHETYLDMADQFDPYWEPVRSVNQAWIQWGKGSGKDHICRTLSARIICVLLCLRSPQRYFGMPVQDEIQTINVATSAQQAHRAFYKPLKTLVQNSSWFSDKADTQEMSIRFDKNIEAVSGHSGAETQEGLNIILAILDEIAAFRTREEVMAYRPNTKREPTNTAENITEVLHTSIKTRFPKTGKLVGISYPRFKGDYIQQKYNAGLLDNMEKKEKSRIYVSFGCTWEINPRVTKEDFADDYEHPNDPAIARAKYECDPQLSANTYMRQTAHIHAAFNKVLDPPPVSFEYYWGQGKEEEVPGWQVRFFFRPDFVAVSGALYAMHGDMAVSDCAAGVAMAHVTEWQEYEMTTVDEEGGHVVTLDRKPHVKLDFVTSFEADMSANPAPREIKLAWFRQLMWELRARGFVTQRYTFDGFQSTDTIQHLESHGIETGRISTDKDPTLHRGTRDIIYEQRLEAYHDAKTIEELIGLTKLPNGRIAHPPGGSKDRADAVTGALVGAIALGGQEAKTDDGEAIQTWPGEAYGAEAFGETDLPVDCWDLAEGGMASGF